MAERMTKRMAIAAVPCSRCGARKGEPCWVRRGVHGARWDAATKLRRWLPAPTQEGSSDG